MKIIKKSKILPVTCDVCKCVLQPKHKDLTHDHFQPLKTVVICPICANYNVVKFEGAEDGN